MSEPSRARTVLVVEDSVLVAFAVEEALSDRGFDVIVAGSLAAGEERIRGIQPFAALLDLHLPDGTTLGLAGRLHAMGCKVALCSGMDAAAVPAGYEFAARFRKPVVVSELIDWVISHDDTGAP